MPDLTPDQFDELADQLPPIGGLGVKRRGGTPPKTDTGPSDPYSLKGWSKRLEVILPELGAAGLAAEVHAALDSIADEQEAALRAANARGDAAEGNVLGLRRALKEVENLDAEIAAAIARAKRAEAALFFYADPCTYDAIGFLADPPNGDFMDDFSEDETTVYYDYDRPMPGKRARAALTPAVEGNWAGRRVTKPKGYAFPGIVRGVAYTSTGALRLIVERDPQDGMLHIFAPEQLDSALTPAVQGGDEPYVPGVVTFEDSPESEFVLYDGFTIYHERNGYQLITDETGEPIGFRWPTKRPPQGPAVQGGDEPDALGHETRSSDSSLYDEICILCGATDGVGDRGLTLKCRGTVRPAQPGAAEE